MKAVVATQYGTPDVLQITDLKKPVPKDNEILVKIYATTVNVGDSRMRSFTVPPVFWLPGRLMLGITKPKNPVFGMELAGEVEQIGKDVTRFKVGDAVYASTLNMGFGAHAEYKCLPEDSMVALKPKNLTYEEATAVPIAADTALVYLQRANIQRGQKVLVNGASGSVGTYAVQLAKHFGAEVTGVCSTRNIELVKSLGADRVIDYTKEDFSKSGQTYDIVFDAVGKTTFSQCQHLIKEKGYYLHTVIIGVEVIAPWYAMTTGKHIIAGNVAEKAENLDLIRDLIEAGVIKPVIDKCYPIEQIAEAHRHVDTGHKRGNVVIQVVPSATSVSTLSNSLLFSVKYKPKRIAE